MSLPALVIAGFAASLGRTSRPVTARLTYSAKRTAQGGMIFATQSASPSDEDAVRMSEALVLTSGGLLGRGAVWARAHGTPAVVLPNAHWDAGRLVVDAAGFGPPQREGSMTFEPVSRTERRAIEEGEVLTVDAANGSVTLYPQEAQQGELELAQALKAYEGLRDGQAVIHWWQGRADEPGSLELAVRLERELAALAIDGEGRASDFVALARAVEPFLPASQRAIFRKESDQAVSREERRAGGLLRDLRQDLMEASSEEAVRALGGRVDLICQALGGLGARVAAVSCQADDGLARFRSKAISGRPAGSWQQAAQAAGAKARPGAVVATDAYARFISETGLGPKIDDIAADASLPLALKSERILRLFASAKLPTAPDGNGPYDFGCDGGLRENVSKAQAPRALLDCWAAFWSPGPLGRRKRAGIASAAPEVSIFPSFTDAVSGTVYSREPGEPSGRLIVAAGGDQYLLDRRGEPLLPPILAGDKQVLTPAQLKRLARIARSLDGWFGEAVEASFTLERDSLFVVSAVPVSPMGR